MINYSQKVAEVLLDIGAVGFSPHKPITFKSGLISPLYVDNRRFPFHPQKWRVVLDGFVSLIKEENLDLDIIAGVEAAGIPHSAALGLLLEKPSVFVRKASKDHGTKKMVEGGEVKEKKVLLIEDHVTMGGSVLRAVQSLRKSGAIVENCLSITSYDFADARKGFEDANIKAYSLTTFPVILQEALKRKMFSEQEKQIIDKWFKDPWGWKSE